MGGDNWVNGVLGGNYAIEQIQKKFGASTTSCPLPLEPQLAKWSPTAWAHKVMVAKYGHVVDFLATPSKAVQVEVNNDFQSPWMDVLAKYPDDKNIVVFSPYEAASGGMYAAA
jgi:hypothetical protein